MPCILGKACGTPLPFAPASAPRPQLQLHAIYTDTNGLTNLSDPCGNFCFQLLVDAANGFMRATPLPNKYDATKNILSHINTLQHQLGTMVKCYYSDSAQEL